MIASRWNNTLNKLYKYKYIYEEKEIKTTNKYKTHDTHPHVHIYTYTHTHIDRTRINRNDTLLHVNNEIYINVYKTNIKME